MAITNKVGPPVTGEDFYGRVNELAQAHSFLDSNHSLALSAPRRIGKSSFAKRLIEDKEKVGWKCVYIDLEGLQTQNDFLNTLINKFDTFRAQKMVLPKKWLTRRSTISRTQIILALGMRGLQYTMDTKR